MSGDDSGARRQSAGLIRLSLPVLAGIAGVGVLTRSPLDAAFGAALAAVVLWVATVDLTRFEIPDAAVCTIFALGLTWTFATAGYDLAIIGDLLLRSLAAGGFLYALRAGYRAVRKTEGLGLGDVKLAAAGAAWLSWPALPTALLIGIAAAALVIVFKCAAERRSIDMQAAIPFGAFLAPAIWAAWFTEVAHF